VRSGGGVRELAILGALRTKAQDFKALVQDCQLQSWAILGQLGFFKRFRVRLTPEPEHLTRIVNQTDTAPAPPTANTARLISPTDPLHLIAPADATARKGLVRFC
jgi:hypothetical protein